MYRYMTRCDIRIINESSEAIQEFFIYSYICIQHTCFIMETNLIYYLKHNNIRLMCYCNVLNICND